MLDAIRPVRADSDEPPTLQAYRALARAVRSGGIRAGSKMPPERLVAQRLGVSRVTARRALIALQEEGVLQSTQGSGWFVAESLFEESHDELTSFTELARRRGLTPSSRVLAQRVRHSTLEESDLLRIAPGADLLHLERLRFLDEVPVATSINLVPTPVGHALVDVDFAERSLFAALRSECGVNPTSADYVLQAREATEQEAQLLDLSVGAPVLQGSDVTVDPDGRVLAIGTTVYRGDRYRFRTTLTTRTPFPVRAQPHTAQGAER